MIVFELAWMKGYRVSMDKNVRWQIQKRKWTGRVVFYDNVKIKSNEKHFLDGWMMRDDTRLYWGWNRNGKAEKETRYGTLQRAL